MESAQSVTTPIAAMKPYAEEAATPSSTSDFDSSSPASSFYNCIEHPHCRTFVTEGFAGGVEVRSKTGKAVVLQKVCRSLKRRLRKSFVAGFEAKKPTVRDKPDTLLLLMGSGR